MCRGWRLFVRAPVALCFSYRRFSYPWLPSALTLGYWLESGSRSKEHTFFPNSFYSVNENVTVVCTNFTKKSADHCRRSAKRANRSRALLHRSHAYIMNDTLLDHRPTMGHCLRRFATPKVDWLVLETRRVLHTNASMQNPSVHRWAWNPRPRSAPDIESPNKAVAFTQTTSRRVKVWLSRKPIQLHVRMLCRFSGFIWIRPWPSCGPKFGARYAVGVRVLGKRISSTR